MSRTHAARPRIALFTTKMEGGGIQRVFATLARGFLARGCDVDVLLVSKRGELLGELPREARVIEVGAAWPLAARPLFALPGAAREVAWRWLATLRPRPAESVGPLARYLHESPPAALLASPTSAALAALWAAHLAQSPVRIVAREASTLSQQIAVRGEWYHARLPELAREWYPRAHVISVSRGAAEDLARLSGLAREHITVIHSPLDGERIRAQAAEAPDEPWLEAPGAPPVVLGVGRLAAAKDYATLLRAFAKLRERLPARLVLLGEGEQRAQLLALAARLGVREHVKLCGFVVNPYAYMARAGVLASSSRYEGFANVLREALACECPVVATDCPSGSAEALEDGALGRLVPVGDADALADALEATLREPPTREERERRARLVGGESAIDAYLEVLLAGRERRSGV